MAIFSLCTKCIQKEYTFVLPTFYSNMQEKKPILQTRYLGKAIYMTDLNDRTLRLWFTYLAPQTCHTVHTDSIFFLLPRNHLYKRNFLVGM